MASRSAMWSSTTRMQGAEVFMMDAPVSFSCSCSLVDRQALDWPWEQEIGRRLTLMNAEFLVLFCAYSLRVSAC